ncbi:piggyBac transposable element-derived protein 3-like protein, partial [Leptotrombidium deliense]
MPLKPVRFGFKNYILASHDGLVFDFEIYQGAQTPMNSNYKSDYGTTVATVLHLARTIPENFTHILYVDRYFTSLKLIELLLARKIFCTGTVMKSRIKSIPFDNENVFKKQQRGYVEELSKSDKSICAIK